MIRHGALGIGLTGLAAVALGKVTHAARLGANFDRPAHENFAFTKTNEAALHGDDMSLFPRARAFIRIGEVGIAREDSAALRAFSHPHFRFHGPAGADADREQLRAYFAACREAFDDFTVTRQSLMSDGVDHIAARTRFAGIFVRTFDGLPTGPFESNGKRFEYRLLIQFRCASIGQLIEEWAHYDTVSFIDQLRR